MQLALPIAALREVVALGALRALPCPADLVAGGIELRGAIVPVLDLRLLRGAAPADCPGASVIVVVHEGRLAGLRVDTVTDIFTATDGSLVRSAGADPGACVFAGSIRREDNGATIGLVCLEALFALAQLPFIEDTRATAQQPSRNDTTPALDEAQVSWLLFGCGQELLAIEATAVAAVLAIAAIEPSALAMGNCRGLVNHGGERIAAVDLAALCGARRRAAGTPGTALVVKVGKGTVALLVDDVIEIVRAHRGSASTMPVMVPNNVALLDGTFGSDILPVHLRRKPRFRDAHFLRIDTNALHGVPDLLALATVTRRDAARLAVEGTDGMARRAVSAGAAMVCFEMLGEFATPIAQLAEIVLVGPEHLHCDGHDALCGTMVRRGRALNLVSLGRLYDPGHPVERDTAALVVASGDQWIGFTVPRLLAIDAPTWEPTLAVRRTGIDPALGAILNSGKLALFGAAPNERMARVLDLALLAACLVARITAAAAGHETARLCPA